LQNPSINGLQVLQYAPQHPIYLFWFTLFIHKSEKRSYKSW
jgi:hypothetical protein